MEILKVNYFFYFSNEYLECKLYNNLVVPVYPGVLSHHGQNYWSKAQTKMQVIIQLKLLYKNIYDFLYYNFFLNIVKIVFFPLNKATIIETMNNIKISLCCVVSVKCRL